LTALFILKGDNVALVGAGVYLTIITAAGWTVCGRGNERACFTI